MPVSSRPSSETFAPATIQIRAAGPVWSVDWSELWRHRELLYFFTWRDLKVRYKQTVLGALWAILQPLAIALSLTLFLGRVVHVPTGDLPYPVFAYAGMALWQLFAQGLTESSNSVVLNERLITKVYFPRIFVPLSAILASLVDFALSLILLALFLLYFRLVPSPAVVLFPVFMLLAAVSSLGAGLWLSALNVKFRDVRYTVNFLVQFWFFATPVAYPLSVVPARLRLLYELNPMVGAVEGFRWSLHSTSSFPWMPVAFSLTAGIVLCTSGLYYFMLTEDTFADFI